MEEPKTRPSTAALILFTDIRGFTRWSEKIEVFTHLNRFVSDFLAIIRRRFPPPAFVKGLGDGAMIVQELAPDEPNPREILYQALQVIIQVNDEFATLCDEFARSVGHHTDLKLGWGVVRGEVKKLTDDYVGSNVNKCARLCDVARPFGIVIDRDDFPDQEDSAGIRFFPQKRILSGIDDVAVWVTAEIFTQFVTRERLRHTPEVHVAGLCIESIGKRGLRLLLATRAPGRKLYPGKIEGCGGQLAYSETFTEGVVRHFRLELGIEVRVLEEFHCFYVIREPNEPVIPGIRFLCERIGDPEPKSINHSKVEWVSETQFRNLASNHFVANLKDEVLDLLDQYKARTRKR
jgi:hypothetical protein